MKTVLITGAAGGLGIGLVREYLSRNYRVFGADIVRIGGFVCERKHGRNQNNDSREDARYKKIFTLHATPPPIDSRRGKRS